MTGMWNESLALGIEHLDQPPSEPMMEVVFDGECVADRSLRFVAHELKFDQADRHA